MKSRPNVSNSNSSIPKRVASVYNDRRLNRMSRSRFQRKSSSRSRSEVHNLIPARELDLDLVTDLSHDLTEFLLKVGTLLQSLC